MSVPSRRRLLHGDVLAPQVWGSAVEASVAISDSELAAWRRAVADLQPEDDRRQDQGDDIGRDQGQIVNRDAVDQPQHDSQAQDHQHAPRNVVCGFAFPGFDQLGQIGQGGEAASNEAEGRCEFHG